mgnify:CR=1 FL=1
MVIKYCNCIFYMARWYGYMLIYKVNIKICTMVGYDARIVCIGVYFWELLEQQNLGALL